jgi:hypothetical protein
MKPKFLAILSLVTVGLVAAALVSKRSREQAYVGAESAGELFPELSAKVNDVNEIAIEKAGQTATLVRAGEQWTCREAGGYRAPFDKVKSTLVALARMEIVEAMTKDPANHKKLGLDLESGARVTLRDASGAVAAELVVGESKYARNGQRVYARRASEDQAYLCAGELTLSGDPLTWVEKEILRLDASRPTRIEITHADGETLTVTKAVPSSPNWDVLDVPEGRSLKTAAVANPLGTALSYLSFDDVKPASELPLGTNHVASARFATFDGMLVDVRLAKVEDKSWITLSTSYEEPPKELGPEAPAEPTAEDASGAEPATDSEVKPAEDRSAEVRAEVAKLEQEFAGWAYAVPQYKADLFQRRMSDLLAEVAPPESEAPPTEVPVEPPAVPLEPPQGDSGAGDTDGG